MEHDLQVTAGERTGAVLDVFTRSDELHIRMGCESRTKRL